MAGARSENKKRNDQYEAIFRKIFTNYAPMYGCRVLEIPDAIKSVNSLKKDVNGKMDINRERKRPFDCILYTPHATISLELKYDNHASRPHQVENIKMIREMNGLGFFLRKYNIFNDYGYIIRERYLLEDEKKNVIEEFSDLTGLFTYLKSLRARNA